VSFTNGHSTTPLATTLRKAETVVLSATSATSPAIASGQPSSSFGVDPGPASKLQVLLPGESAAPGTASGKTGTPTAQVSGVAIVNNVRVNAVDADWNVIGGAAADVAIGSSDVAAAIADDNGAAGGNLTLAAGSGTLSSFVFGTGGGSQTVNASDVAAVLNAGTSASVTVNKPASATGLVSSQNPAVSGQSVTFTATVTGGGGTPTGTVDFKDGATVIGSAVALNGSGVAQFTPSSLTVATHTISAVYSGSAFYAASTSANLSQVVSKAGTATSLASSLNPACAGQSVMLTATVTVVAPGAGALRGQRRLQGRLDRDRQRHPAQCVGRRDVLHLVALGGEPQPDRGLQRQRQLQHQHLHARAGPGHQAEAHRQRVRLDGDLPRRLRFDPGGPRRHEPLDRDLVRRRGPERSSSRAPPPAR
jgi:hypothetical protein